MNTDFKKPTTSRSELDCQDSCRGSGIRKVLRTNLNKLYAGGRHNMPRPSPPSHVRRHSCGSVSAEPTAPADRSVVVGSHGQYVPTVTAPAA